MLVSQFKCATAYGAFYQDNEALINYINHQPLALLLTCLGDGHEGIWNIISHLNPGKNRRKILDWYHLIENLYKVGGPLKQPKPRIFCGKARATELSTYLS